MIVTTPKQTENWSLWAKKPGFFHNFRINCRNFGQKPGF